MATEATTPSQTVGPFFALPDGLLWEDGPEVVPSGDPGAITVYGYLLDGRGAPVPDGIIETWQADEHGRFDHPGDPRVAAERDAGNQRGVGDQRNAASPFRGFGRSGTNSQGRFWLRTRKPGSLPTPSGRTEAPHIDVSVLARGLLNRVVTRLYFGDEQRANEADPVLSTVEADRRGTLIATPDAEGYRFDIHLQGDAETVFFLV